MKASVQWMIGYGNSPRLVIEVDEPIALGTEAPIWTRESNGYVWTEQDGLISYIYMGQPTESGAIGGYGGREIVRTLKDGTVLRSRDCWSGNSRGLPFEAMECIVEYNGSRQYMAVRKELGESLLKEIGLYVVQSNIGFWYPSMDASKIVKPQE